jgi:hypothetical protein
MEVKFAQLETLVISMVAHVKSNGLPLDKGRQGIKKMENILVWMLTQDIFVESIFKYQWPQMKITNCFRRP